MSDVKAVIRWASGAKGVPNNAPWTYVASSDEPFQEVEGALARFPECGDIIEVPNANCSFDACVAVLEVRLRMDGSVTVLVVPAEWEDTFDDGDEEVSDADLL